MEHHSNTRANAITAQSLNLNLNRHFQQVITKEFLDAHAIDFVAHDDLPYADTSGQVDDVYGPVRAGGRLREQLGRTVESGEAP